MKNLLFLCFTMLSISFMANPSFGISKKKIYIEIKSPYSCKPVCESRNSSGGCISYGQDICGHKIECVPNCLSRNTSGRCISYGKDLCGMQIACSKKCDIRDQSGNCVSYLKDGCATSPSS